MGRTACDVHAGAPAAFSCMSCNVYACSGCAKHVWVKDRFEDQCARCNRALSPVVTSLADEPASHERGVAALLAELPRIALFPFRRSTVFMLLGLALICAPIYYALRYSFTPGLAVLGLFLILTIEASVYFRIVVQSAFGKVDVDPPDITELAAELFAPAVRYLATLLPMVVAILWFGEQASGSVWAGFLLFLKPTLIFDFTGPAALLVTGIVLWPLLTVIAAMNESVLAIFNPGTWLDAVRIMGGTYVVGALGFYAIVAFQYLVLTSLLIWFKGKVDIFALTSVVVLFVSYLPLALRARLLGAMVEPYMGVND